MSHLRIHQRHYSQLERYAKLKKKIKKGGRRNKFHFEESEGLFIWERGVILFGGGGVIEFHLLLFC